MALEGFEPPTPRLRVWCSNQAELQSLLAALVLARCNLSLTRLSYRALSKPYIVFTYNLFKKLTF